MKKISLLTFCSFILLSGCVSLTGLEEGKTLGEGNSEVGAGIAYTSSPDILDDEGAGFDGTISYPTLDLSYKRGITDKLDVGGRLTSSLSAGLFLKYQIVGDQNSKFTMAPGLDLSTFAGLTYAIQVPLNMSVHPSKSLSINFAPRFIYQGATGSLSTGVNYLGGNAGLLFGKRHKFGLDVGFYSVGSDGARASFINFGIGGRFRFGDFDSEEEDDEKEKKKSKRKRR